jgi:hypothetical protein
VLGCASAGNVIARKEATVQAVNRQLMMHSPEYARAWMAPHNQPTFGRVVPAIGVSAPATAASYHIAVFKRRRCERVDQVDIYAVSGRHVLLGITAMTP